MTPCACGFTKNDVHVHPLSRWMVCMTPSVAVRRSGCEGGQPSVPPLLNRSGSSVASLIVLPVEERHSHAVSSLPLNDCLP